MLKRLAAIAAILIFLSVVVALAYLVHQHRNESLRSPAPEMEGPVVLIELPSSKEIT